MKRCRSSFRGPAAGHEPSGGRDRRRPGGFAAGGTKFCIRHAQPATLLACHVRGFNAMGIRTATAVVVLATLGVGGCQPVERDFAKRKPESLRKERAELVDRMHELADTPRPWPLAVRLERLELRTRIQRIDVALPPIEAMSGSMATQGGHGRIQPYVPLVEEDDFIPPQGQLPAQRTGGGSRMDPPNALKFDGTLQRSR